MRPAVKLRIWLAVLAAGPATGPAAARPEPVRDEQIVIRAPIARGEIERILSADNLDTIGGHPRAIADAMARIPRGRAPADFWESYERHLAAWERYAEAVDSNADETERIMAERVINSSFDAVERIARRYGARIPNARSK